MKVNDRRKAIVNLLSASKDPVAGNELSKQFGVSRQIIVQDITVLKGLGYEIFSTHHGYVLQKSPLVERVFKLKHTTEQTEDVLNSIVDLGGTIIDEFVWHKVYGKISATLNIFSRLHVKQFLEGVRTGKSTELMNITGGYHYLTVRAESEEILDNIGLMLKTKNYIALGD
ncbi:MAG: transcription repressor NadR [Clostridiales bacterium]|nr:transcription repressor NadR [Clostridiales bacterium]